MLRGIAVCRAAGGGSALAALDADGNAVTASKWLAKHPAGDRNLVQGLKSDATYLIGEHCPRVLVAFWALVRPRPVFEIATVPEDSPRSFLLVEQKDGS